MSYTIPFTFASESGNQPAAQLDQSFAVCALGVNNAFLVGTIAGRPSPDGIGNGRYYFATDLNGGTLFRDSGTVWVQVAPGVAAPGVGSYSVRALVGANNAGTPNTKYDLTSADLITFRNPTTGGTNVVAAQGLLTCDLTVQGRNGRDQAGALATSAFVHLYYTWDGTTVATRASQSAPPTGPTLANGEIAWAYAGAVFNATGPALVKTRMRGSVMWYETRQAALSSGAATVETSVSLAAFIPPNALEWDGAWNAVFATTGASDGAAVFNLRFVSGSDFIAPGLEGIGGPHGNNYHANFRMPNQGQNFFYLWSSLNVVGSQALTVYVDGYKIPNGGE
jgi:hypothetical protein